MADVSETARYDTHNNGKRDLQPCVECGSLTRAGRKAIAICSGACMIARYDREEPARRAKGNRPCVTCGRVTIYGNGRQGRVFCALFPNQSFERCIGPWRAAIMERLETPCLGDCGRLPHGLDEWCDTCSTVQVVLEEAGAASLSDLSAAGPGRDYDAIWRIKDLVRRSGVDDAEDLIEALERILRGPAERAQ